MIWSLRRALGCLCGSTLVTLFIGLTSLYFWKSYRWQRLLDPQFYISSIVQTGPEKEALKTACLAELLGLSSDQPLSLYALNPKKAALQLLASPLIEKAEVKRLFPSTVYIDYEMRKPFYLLADYHNVAGDAEGHLFPLVPFFTPKELPEVYLGLPPFETPSDRLGRKGGSWKEPLQGPYFELAVKILKHLQALHATFDLQIKRIDVSNAFHESLGSREIVLLLEEEVFVSREGTLTACTFPKILRLSPKDFEQQWAHFLALKNGMMEEYKRKLEHTSLAGRFSPRIIDLRIPEFAFVDNR